MWHDVCNTAPPTCISVNFVEVPLNVIRCNVHKTVVSYKTVQAFCSDVAIQNVNIISSPTCMVLCFKKHCVSPVKCFMLETSPFTVTPSTKLSSSSPLSPSSSLLSLSLSSISTSPSLLSSSLPLLNPPLTKSPSQHLNYCHKVALQWFPKQSEVCSLLQAKNFFDFFSILGCKVWVTSIFLFPS